MFNKNRLFIIAMLVLTACSTNNNSNHTNKDFPHQQGYSKKAIIYDNKGTVRFNPNKLDKENQDEEFDLFKTDESGRPSSGNNKKVNNKW